MNRTKISGDDSKDFKKSPNLDLRGKVGNRVIGIFRGRLESKAFPGKYTTILEVVDTDGDTELYNPQTKISEPVDISQGDKVFLSESTVLANSFNKVAVGQKVEVVYKGKGTAKAGRKAPYLYDVFLIEEN